MSSSKPDIVLHAQGISKSYGSLTALTDLSFEVGAGETVGLLGPNGAGKTTAIRILSTVLSPDSAFAPVAGPSLFIHAEPDQILPLGNVMPAVSLVPVFPLTLFLFGIVHRRRRSAAALPISCG